MNRLSGILLAGSTLVSLAMASFASNPTAYAAAPNQNEPGFSFPRYVSIRKSTSATGSTKVGDTFNYTLELKNDTAQDATVSVTDSLPSQVELVGSPTMELNGFTGISPTVSGTLVSWSGRLPKEQKATITIQTKLLTCNIDEGRSRSITNIALMVVEGKGFSSSSVAFRPSSCSDDPTPPTTSTLPADVAVTKFARLHLDWARPERGWQASWYVGYQNRSGQTANDVVITDSPSSNQALVSLRSWPNISPTTTSDGLQFNVGNLAKGRGGSIWLRTTVPATTTASTVLTNSVSITASNDASLSNNTKLVSITLPTLPPSITYPRSGATCTETITVTGRAQANANLQLYLDGAPALTTTANSEGLWEANLKLEDGVNVLFVRTLRNSNEPEHDGDDDDDRNHWGGWGDYRQSNVVLLNVDTDLNWDPISLNFADPNGNKTYSRHWLGWFERTGWYVGLQPSTTYTVGVKVCCQDLTATVMLTVPGVSVSGTVTVTEGTAIELTDPDGDRIYTGVWTTGDAKSLKFNKLTLCVNGDGELQCSRGRTYPVWPKASRTIFITENGFDAAKLTVAAGEVVEFVNLDVKSRAFSSSRNLGAQANGSEALSADDDAVRLEVGESYSVQVPSSSITYYDSQNSTESITLETASNAVFLPLVIKR